MRKPLVIALGAAAALVTAAVAFAAVPAVVGIHSAKATFSTTAVGKLKTRECTAAGQTWKFTDAHYTGTVISSDPVLGGALRIDAKTTYNTTSPSASLGYVEGSFRIGNDDSRVSGRFNGTIANGKLVGFLTGKSRGNHARVLGNISADFSGGSSHFLNGQIGSDSSPAVLAVVAGPPCKPAEAPKPPQGPKPRHVEAEGTLKALALATADATGSVTVTTKKGDTTCTIPKGSTLGTGFAVDSRVELECEEMGSPAVMTATSLKKHK